MGDRKPRLRRDARAASRRAKSRCSPSSNASPSRPGTPSPSPATPASISALIAMAGPISSKSTPTPASPPTPASAPPPPGAASARPMSSPASSQLPMARTRFRHVLDAARRRPHSRPDERDRRVLRRRVARRRRARTNHARRLRDLSLAARRSRRRTPRLHLLRSHPAEQGQLRSLLDRCSSRAARLGTRDGLDGAHRETRQSPSAASGSLPKPPRATPTPPPAPSTSRPASTRRPASPISTSPATTRSCSGSHSDWQSGSSPAQRGRGTSEAGGGGGTGPGARGRPHPSLRATFPR